MSSTNPVPPLLRPPPVQITQALLIVVAASHLIVPLVMQNNRGALRDEIGTQHPELSVAEIARSADIAIASAAVFHGILLVLCAVLVWKLATAQPWTRRLTTVSQLLSVAFSVLSWSSSPMFHTVIPFIGLAQILSVTLVWAPRSSRTFFAHGAQRRRTARSRSGNPA